MKRSGVPASITLAQGILESESGNSELVKKSNNHFGIKCKSTWTGDKVAHDDDANDECFRAYTNAEDSYRDHSDFLRSNQRYASLFKLDPTDYTGWAKGLKKAGYATNPRYPHILIKYIEQYDLQQYSLIALNKLPETEIAEKTNSKNIEPVANSDKSDVQVSSDPDKIFIVNQTKCVLAKKGTSLLLIADKNKISLSKLMEFNDLTEEGILQEDQYIFLQKKPKTGETDIYIVQSGETLYGIAQINGIQLKYLLLYNNLSATAVLNNTMRLALKPGLQPLIGNGDNKKSTVHRVAPKEGLYAIAKAYHVTVQQLKEWNNLDSDNLKIGQEIIVSK